LIFPLFIEKVKLSIRLQNRNPVFYDTNYLCGFRPREIKRIYLKNNHVYACFTKYGGRLVNDFIYDPVKQDGFSVIGSPAFNPSAPGEEEYTGTSANRCSAVRNMKMDFT